MDMMSGHSEMLSRPMARAVRDRQQLIIPSRRRDRGFYIFHTVLHTVRNIDWYSPSYRKHCPGTCYIVAERATSIRITVIFTIFYPIAKLPSCQATKSSLSNSARHDQLFVAVQHECSEQVQYSVVLPVTTATMSISQSLLSHSRSLLRFLIARFAFSTLSVCSFAVDLPFHLSIQDRLQLLLK